MSIDSPSDEDPETLHPDWLRWIAENLARGATADEVVAELRREGVAEALAREHTTAIAASVGLAEARRLHHRVLALEQIVRLRRQHRDTLQGPVRRIAMPSAEEFAERYLLPGVPVVLTDLVPRWPAFGRWTHRWLAERFGDVKISACLGRRAHAKPDADWAELRRTMPLRELLDAIDNGADNDAYAIAKNALFQLPELAPLLDDLLLPEALFGPKLVPSRMGLWIGGAGTHTSLHHDGDNSIFCQVFGSKRVWLAPAESLPLLDEADGVYAKSEGGEQLTPVDVAAGEALLIPAGWWHRVDALSPSITVTILELAWPNDYGWYRPGSLLRGRGTEL